MIEKILRFPFLGLAALLEITAECLRGIAGHIKLPVFAPAATSPIGYWRCLHSCDHFAKDFTPGKIYKAQPCPPQSSSIRIIPANYTNWAPYWEPREERFCYSADVLDFEYVGNILPKGETCLSS